MTPAYERTYLVDAEDCLSSAFDYAVHDCGVTGDAFAGAFIRSGLAALFERGNPAVVAGMSGIELAARALSACGLLDEEPEPTYGEGLSPEYWAGFAVARYQWSRGCRFVDLFEAVPFSRIVSLYQPYHEADISLCLEAIDRLAGSSAPTNTRLARMRKRRGLTQAELARRSGVGIKSIQAYEQRVNALGKATTETTLRLAWSLGCRVEDLLEFQPPLEIEYDSGTESEGS